MENYIKIHKGKLALLLVPGVIVLVISFALVYLGAGFRWAANETMDLFKWMVSVTSEPVSKEEFDHAMEEEKTQRER